MQETDGQGSQTAHVYFLAVLLTGLRTDSLAPLCLGGTRL